MPTILDKIVETKRREVAVAKDTRSVSELKKLIGLADPPRDFYKALLPCNERVHLIAELKRRSPSAGVIVADFDPVAIAKIFHANGAAALSVLTDEEYFQGRLQYIEMVKHAVPLPVLRKDFLIDDYQVYESRAAGADAILLIVEVLGVSRTKEMLAIGQSLGLAVLIEVHDEENLKRLLEAVGLPMSGHYLLGINNRDLSVQKTNLLQTKRLASLLPSGTPFIAESGIKTHADVRAAHQAGATAMLVGESLLRADDIGAKVRGLLEQPNK